jgi:spoIIIJ-associated protein
MSEELIISAHSAEEAIEEAVHSWEIPAEELVAEPIPSDTEEAGVQRFRVHRRVTVKTLDPTAARELMAGLLAAMKIEATFEDRIEDEYIHMNIQAEDAGLLIGKYGRTLEALQLMMNLMVQKRDPDCGLRVVLDAAGYRDKRAEQLGELARKAVSRVRESRREYAFKPMSPIDRRIVHRVLLETDGITTFSRGLGEDRYVVVAPVGADGQPLPGRPRHKGRDRGPHRDRGPRRDRGPQRDRGSDRERQPRRHDRTPRESRPVPEGSGGGFSVFEGESLSGRLATGEARPEEVFGPQRPERQDREGERRGHSGRGRDERRGGGERGRGERRGEGERRRGGRGPDSRSPGRPRGQGQRDASAKPPSYRLPEDEPLWASEGRDPEFD